MTRKASSKRTSRKGRNKDDLERKRDERSRRNALKKEREAKDVYCASDDEDFVSFKNQLQAEGHKLKDILGDG